MAAASSPVTSEAYGVRRVCAAWGMPRSSFYAARTVSEAPPPGRRRAQHGSDQARMVRRTRLNKGGRIAASCVQKTPGGTLDQPHV